MNNSQTPGGAHLLSIIERIERLEEEKKAISDDIREVKSEAKASGFSVATINTLVKLRKMDTAERQEYEALLDIYKAAIGMLDGTPLGEAARRRMMDDEPPEEKKADDKPSEPVTPPPNQDDIQQAREKGMRDRLEGSKILDNPYIAGDPRRAAWDEGYCEESGSDGMDIPEAWKPRPKKKPAETKSQEENDQQDGDRP
ncbi:MAG: hypothetical protein COB78_10025 [Hyphomicrobiales bacterium]|nr:MAG: hypothetical protein COB78_10025 [Hyphomicrobiales bacterium]